MIGLYVLLLGAIWLALASAISYSLGTLVDARPLRLIVRLLLAVVLLPFPVADELVARNLFPKTCEERARFIVDAQETQGRSVWLGRVERSSFRLGMLEVIQTQFDFLDAASNARVYHYMRLQAQGGLLARFIGVPEGGGPLTFPGYCQPENIEAAEEQLGTKQVSRPTSN